MERLQKALKDEKSRVAQVRARALATVRARPDRGPRAPPIWPVRRALSAWGLLHHTMRR